ncbi:alpha 2 protein [Berrimah virus]|uniref:Alpha 2 protein n=1 Tax=Berrimah virus TaxID=318834 RepID=I3NUY0_9RHAB|nr:alpha 2 protein [Berrimah virus]AEH58022.1 alpha 2 protein [Berrimah virus]
MFGYIEIKIILDEKIKKDVVHKLELWRLTEEGLFDLMAKGNLNSVLKEEANFGFCRWLNTKGNWLNKSEMRKPIIIEFQNLFDCPSSKAKVYKTKIANREYKLGSIKEMTIKLFFF